jgi:hypothetical protein
MKRILIAGTLALLLGACQPAPAPTPSAPPTITPTPFTVVALATAGTVNPTPEFTPVRGGLRPTPLPPDVLPPTPLPPAKLAVGAPVFRLPDSSPDQIRSIVLNPAAPELLISLYDGVNAKTLRVSWGKTSQPVIEPLPGEWVQPRYSADGKRIIANGLQILDKEKPQPATPDAAAFAPNYSIPDNRLAYLKKLPPEQCAGQGIPEDLNYCAGIVIDAGQPQGARPYLSGPAEWSPDGKYLLLTTAGEVGSTLFVYDIAAKTYQQIVPDPDRFRPGAPQPPPNAPDGSSFISAIWSADSQKIYFISQSFELFVVPITGGVPSPLGPATQPHLRQGTDFLYYLKPLDGGYFELWRRNTRTGANQIVSDAAFHCADGTWSPDGATLACVDVIENERAVILYAVPQ